MTKCTEPMNDIPWELQDAEDCHEPLTTRESAIAVTSACTLVLCISLIALLVVVIP